MSMNVQASSDLERDPVSTSKLVRQAPRAVHRTPLHLQEPWEESGSNCSHLAFLDKPLNFQSRVCLSRGVSKEGEGCWERT